MDETSPPPKFNFNKILETFGFLIRNGFVWFIFSIFAGLGEMDIKFISEKTYELIGLPFFLIWPIHTFYFISVLLILFFKNEQNKFFIFIQKNLKTSKLLLFTPLVFVFSMELIRLILYLIFQKF
jgi:hypothetical protein